MKHLLAVALCISTLSEAYACDRNLTGTWKSDRKMSMAFITDNSKIQPKTEAFLDALLGHLTLTFTHTTVHIVMPDINVPISGELRPFVGYEDKKSYTTLFCSPSMIVWSAKHPFGSGDEATTFHFEGPDTVWVYTGSTVTGAPDLHGREYFRRVAED